MTHSVQQLRSQDKAQSTEPLPWKCIIFTLKRVRGANPTPLPGEQSLGLGKETVFKKLGWVTFYLEFCFFSSRSQTTGFHGKVPGADIHVLGQDECPVTQAGFPPAREQLDSVREHPIIHKWTNFIQAQKPLLQEPPKGGNFQKTPAPSHCRFNWGTRSPWCL